MLIIISFLKLLFHYCVTSIITVMGQQSISNHVDMHDFHAHQIQLTIGGNPLKIIFK